MRDLQLKQFQALGGETPNQSEAMSAAVKQEVESHVATLETTFKFDFKETEVKNDPTHNYVLSPEEEKDIGQAKAMQNMKICMYLDEFFDVVFNVDQSFIKANSFVLKNRSEYFGAMFSSANKFREGTGQSL